MEVHAFAAKKPGSTVEPFTYNTSPLKPYEVGIKISHCGLCHTDLTVMSGVWGEENFPFVPGHEVIGVIDEVGSEVTDVKIGDRVGMSWQVGSCLTCEWCTKGFEQLCTQTKEFFVGRYGGMGDYVVSDGRFVYKIPEQITSEEAAPLLCAGITVYQPLKFYGIQKGMTVGVIGMGGLGHLAVQFANAWECEVTVFTRQKEKEADAKRFGAKELVTDISQNDLKRSFDIIIDTTNANVEWDTYLQMLSPLGKFILCGIPSKDITISPFSLIGGQVSIGGGSLGGRESIKEMLEFAVDHDVRPQVEVMPMNKVNDAIKNLEEGKARYRYVLKV